VLRSFPEVRNVLQGDRLYFRIAAFAIAPKPEKIPDLLHLETEISGPPNEAEAVNIMRGVVPVSAQFAIRRRN
jgi:hypothetical protein